MEFFVPQNKVTNGHYLFISRSHRETTCGESESSPEWVSRGCQNTGTNAYK